MYRFDYQFFKSLKEIQLILKWLKIDEQNPSELYGDFELIGFFFPMGIVIRTVEDGDFKIELTFNKTEQELNVKAFLTEFIILIADATCFVC